VEKATNVALTKALSEARHQASDFEQKFKKIEAADTSKKIINEQLVSDIEVERAEKEGLSKELEKSNARVNDLERGARRILELQSNIANKNVFDGTLNDEFDQMMKNLQLEKDFEIDALRKDLVDAKQMKTGVEAELRGQLEVSENVFKETKADLESKLERKEGKISALQSAMESQEQTMNYMRAEMDQLQGNMEKVALERRAEHEEMQQEFMDTQAKATKQEREISSLKMRLEETKLKRKDEAAKLKAKIAVLEEESPLQRNIQLQRDDKRIEELSDEIQHLKWQNNSLSGENENLNKKLSDFEGTNQKSSKNDKWRNTALKEQIKALTNRIKELENMNPPANNKRTHFAKTVQISTGQTSDSSKGGLSTVTKYTF